MEIPFVFGKISTGKNFTDVELLYELLVSKNY